jgi:RNA polymerase sigma-70 factor (ECF subfamily)
MLPQGEVTLSRETEQARRAIVYCIVPADLADKLHEPLYRHFAGDPRVEVVVDYRNRDRRSPPDRRSATAPTADDRRRIRAEEGRRVADRRATITSVDPPELPRALLRFADRLEFVERLEPTSQHLEDVDTARLVMRFQAGEHDVFADLYRRYFDRVYGYLKVALRDAHEAEDVCQQVFLDVFSGLERYERRSQPFRGWLYVVVRNHAVSRLKQLGRLEPSDPLDLDRKLEDGRPRQADDSSGDALSWISDRELVLFIERLPLAQRQVLVLRYLVGLSSSETAVVLGRSPEAVRQQQVRALAYLRQRLQALGRAPRATRRSGHRVLIPQARVIRARRFSLMRPGSVM